MNTDPISIPDINDIKAAAKRLEGKIIHTPLLRSDALDALTGAQVFVKAECLQTTGSFKLRGASNALALLTDEQRAGGVVACSSGNHAQGVAEAARRLGISATIVMPSDSPAMKIARTKRNGATVVLYDRATQDRDEIANEIAEREHRTFVHPFNNPNVIAGQGTSGLEIVGDLQAMGLSATRIMTPTGGGGLTSGLSISIHDAFPEAKIHTVEPQGFDDFKRSLEAGEILSNDALTGSICDAVMTLEPGTITFEVVRQHCSEGLVVSDASVCEAVRFAFEEFKLVVEPGAAAALAALLDAGQKYQGEVIVVMISGGNADPELFSKILTGELNGSNGL
ncbi:MAG: threonine/serine dehydratase [Rhizobiaceae bacterium]